MWIVHLLPDAWLLAITSALIVAGVVGYAVATFIKRFPYINIYRVPIQIASVVIFVLGVYWRGGLAIEQEWRERVREVEAQLAAAEQRSKKINTRIVTRIKERVKHVHHTRTVIKKEIQERRVEINQGCELSPAAVEMYNRAVTGEAKNGK